MPKTDAPPQPLPVQSALSRRDMLRRTGLTALTLALPRAAHAAGRRGLDPAVRWGREAMRRAMAQPGAPAAMSAVLLQDSEIVWREALGWAVPGRLKAGADTRFNIGSVSKVLAALATVILQDRGQVHLDAPLVRYLPDFAMLSPECRQITLRHLLSHCSGLPGTNGRNLYAFAPVSGYAADTEVELADTHLKHPPGELAVYCNDGFTLIEQVVQAVTGKPYAAFVQEAILEPLGMQRSGFNLAPFPAGSYAHPLWDGKTLGQEFVSAYATGGLASTPEDMMRLARLFIDGGVFEGRRIVSEAGVAQMGTSQTAGLKINPCPEWNWGLGWDFTAQPGMAAAGVQCWQKNGGTAFYSTDFYVVPKARMAFMITASGHGYKPAVIAEGVLLRALHAARTIPALPRPVGTQIPPEAAVDASSIRPATGIYGNYEGAYKVAFGPDLSLSIHRWHAGKWQSVAEGMRLRSDGWWWGDKADEGSFRFDMAPGHRYLILRMPWASGVSLASMPVGQQLQPLETPLSAAWQARVGVQWRLDNESPESAVWTLDPAQIYVIGTLAELPGYLMWRDGQLLRPLSDTRAGMTVRVPVNNGRDLDELVIENRNGEETLRVGGSRLVRKT
ncbi:MAG: serine hydrolase domain-containing protein [Bordetella sp.]|uniref:serine hydrolase domain-containing protein n=1 Tax=Bordetella sp. TaxID=28081 RepID=UPI003F7C04C4